MRYLYINDKKPQQQTAQTFEMRFDTKASDQVILFVD